MTARGEPAWAGITAPAERFAASPSDRGQHPARRAEAGGVLRLHRPRLQALEAWLALGAPEILPLGVLMLVPEALEARGVWITRREGSRTARSTKPAKLPPNVSRAWGLVFFVFFAFFVTS